MLGKSTILLIKRFFKIKGRNQRFQTKRRIAFFLTKLTKLTLYMKNTLRFLAFAIGLMVLFFSCSEEFETPKLDDGQNYFPFEPGFWIEYSVDTILYSVFASGGIDTLQYQVREEFGETFEDNEGRTAMTIKRYVRATESVPWNEIVPTIWYAVRTEDRAERIEGDLRFMKLVFPVADDRKWSGNSFINTELDELAVFNDWQYTYTETGQPQTINGLPFDSTLTVLQNDYEDLVEKLYSQEVYAKGAGLVYKEQWLLNLGGNDINPAVPWPDRAERGEIVITRVIDYQR